MFCNQVVQSKVISKFLLQLPPFPFLELTLCRFIAYLARSLSYSTIQTYLSAIRHLNVELGYRQSNDEMSLVRLLLRGVRRTKGSAVSPKQRPVTLSVMKVLKEELRSSRFRRLTKLCSGPHLQPPSAASYAPPNSVLRQNPVSNSDPLS